MKSESLIKLARLAKFDNKNPENKKDYLFYAGSAKKVLFNLNRY